MAHEDQFTAVGPPFTGSGFPRSGFSTKATGMVYGVNVAGDRCGVLGSDDPFPRDSIENVGVQGNSGKGVGVHGHSDDSTGVWGWTNKGWGVHGHSNTNTGVFGHSGPPEAANNPNIRTGFGVHGDSPNFVGVHGTSLRHSGVDGFSRNSTGVFGHSETGWGVHGATTNNRAVFGHGLGDRDPVGVWGESENGVGVVGVSADGTAGHFNGFVEVLGDLEVGGNKAFKIDHPLDPENKYLLHNSIESSERKNVYDGLAQLDEEGVASVDLPEWFEALNGDFRYQLTAIGGAAPDLHVAEEISENRFKIAGGEGGMKVCWQVTGSRKDAWASANPFVVEQEKPEEERGLYLQPGLYDAPEEQSVITGRM
jgi:hypothetical protein